MVSTGPLLWGVVGVCELVRRLGKRVLGKQAKLFEVVWVLFPGRSVGGDHLVQLFSRVTEMVGEYLAKY